MAIGGAPTCPSAPSSTGGCTPTVPFLIQHQQLIILTTKPPAKSRISQGVGGEFSFTASRVDVHNRTDSNNLPPNFTPKQHFRSVFTIAAYTLCNVHYVSRSTISLDTDLRERE